MRLLTAERVEHGERQDVIGDQAAGQKLLATGQFVSYRVRSAVPE